MAATNPSTQTTGALLKAAELLVGGFLASSGLKHQLLLVGSRLLETDLAADSDLDLVLVVLGAPKDFRGAFFRDFSLHLQALQDPSLSEIAAAVEGVLIPVLSWRLRLPGLPAVSVDLALCCTPASQVKGDLSAFSPSDWQDLGSADLLAIDSWRCALFILEALPDAGVSKALFSKLVRWIKAWAVSKQIYTNLAGYLCGFSWTLMVLYFLQHRSTRSTTTTTTSSSSSSSSDLIPSFETLLHGFFEFYAAYDWTQPLCFGKDKPIACKHPMTILGPLPPYNNTTRGITRSGRFLVTKSLEVAWQSLSAPEATPETLSQQLTLTPLAEISFIKGFMLVSIGAITPEGMQQVRGWAKSQLVRLVKNLEGCSEKILVLPYGHVLDHPNENYPHGLLLVLGIGRSQGTAERVGPVLEAFTQSFERWCSTVFVPSGFGITFRPAADSPGIKIKHVRVLPTSLRAL